MLWKDKLREGRLCWLGMRLGQSLLSNNKQAVYDTTVPGEMISLQKRLVAHHTSEARYGSAKLASGELDDLAFDKSPHSGKHVLGTRWSTANPQHSLCLGNV